MSSTPRDNQKQDGAAMDAPLMHNRKKYAYDHVVAEIQRMIRDGEIRAGERLPAERRLSETLGASRNSVRQAIQTLSERGILESRRGDGTYVRALDRRELLNSFELAIQAQKEALKDILEFRLLMEPQIAYLAAIRITREEIDRLKVIVCDQERGNVAGRDNPELDARFHFLLAEATRNRVVRQVFDTINAIMNESRSELVQNPRRRKASVIGHFRIIDALEARDAEGARQAMRDHLKEVEQTIFSPEDEGDGHHR